MNKAWHAANPVPPKATLDQRIRWHAEHARACACRPSPDNLRKDVQRLLSSAQEKRMEQVRATPEKKTDAPSAGRRHGRLLYVDNLSLDDDPAGHQHARRRYV